MNWSEIWEQLTGETSIIQSISHTQTGQAVDFVELFNPANFKEQRASLVAGETYDVKINPAIDLTRESIRQQVRKLDQANKFNQQIGFDREKFLKDVATGSPNYANFLQTVQHEALKLPMHDLDVDRAVRKAAILHYGVKASPRTSSSCKIEDAMRPHVFLGWKLWKQLQLLGTHTLKDLFRGWYLAVALSKHRLRHRQSHRLHKRRQMNEYIALSATAADTGNQRELHKIIRALATKQVAVKMQLRRQDGLIMSHSEEVIAVKDHMQMTFVDCDAMSLELSGCNIVPFSESELLYRLQLLPTHKATPKIHAESAFVKFSASVLAPILYDKIQRSWTGSIPAIPESWRTSWLTWLPKPHKNHATLKGWRGIALQNAVGKAVLKCVERAARSTCDEELKADPQFAYSSCRGTGEPIFRAVLHQATALKLGRATRITLHERKAGLSSNHLGGGFQVCLDIERAFDAVPRDKLIAAAIKHKVGLDECSILSSWHASTPYISSSHPDATVTGNIGVRQGCVAAPTLWNLYIHDFLTQMHKVFSKDWIRDHVNVFADDFHLFFAFGSETEIQEALRDLRRFLDEMSVFGLKINTGKTGFLLHLRGRRASKWRSKLIRGRGDEAKIRLESVEKHGVPLFIPLVSEHKYLGIMLSYRRCSDATLNLRKRAAMGTFARLRKWWGSMFPLHHRIKLWYQTVWPTLCYGLADVGLTARGMRQFGALVFRQIRRLARSPLHVTRERNADLCSRLGITDPLSQLCNSVFHLWQRRLEKLEIISPKDFLQNIPQLCKQAVDAEYLLLPWWNQCLPHWVHSALIRLPDDNEHRVLRLLGLQAPSPQPTTEPMLSLPSSQAECYSCSICAKQFPNQMALRVHTNSMHNPVPPSSLSFSVILDSLGGLPTCRHCKMRFAKWQGLKQHLDKDTCPFREARHLIHESHQVDAEQSPLLNSHLLRECVADHGAEALLGYSWFSDKASRSCIICTQWCPTGGALAYHMRTAHYDLYIQGRTWCMNRLNARALSITNPCTWCHQTFAPSSVLKKHFCIVVVQAGVAAHSVEQSGSVDAATASAAAAEPRDVKRRICGKRDPRCLSRSLAQHGRQQQATAWSEQSTNRRVSAATTTAATAAATCQESPKQQHPTQRRRQRVKGPPRRHGEAVLEHGQSIDTTRGRAKSRSPRHRLSDSHADNSTSLACPTSNLQKVARRARGRAPSRSPIAHASRALLLLRAQSAAQKDRWLGCNFGDHAAALSRSDSQQRWLLPEHQVGRQGQKSDHHGSWTPTSRSLSQVGDHGATPSSPSTCTQIPFQQTHGTRIQWEVDNVLARAWHSRPAVQRHFQHDCDVSRHDDLGHHAGEIEKGDVAEITIGERHPEAARQPRVAAPSSSSSSSSLASSSSALTTSTSSSSSSTLSMPLGKKLVSFDEAAELPQPAAKELVWDTASPTCAYRTWLRDGHNIIPVAKLHNPGNYCYCNATISALLVCYHRTVTQNKELAGSWGCIHEIALAACGDWNGLFSVPAFHKMMQGWHEPERQHDVGEFIRHISRSIPLIQPVYVRARYLADGEVIDEEGMLALDLLHDPTSVASAIQHWHIGRGIIHALLEAPPVLFIPVARFDYVDRQPLRAIARMRPEPSRLELPIYIADSIDVILVSYQLVACIMHRGPSPSSGHYRMLALLDGGFMISDDERASSHFSTPREDDLREISLLYLIRSDCIAGTH